MHIDEIKACATEKARNDKRTLYGIREKYNPLLSLNIDLYS